MIERFERFFAAVNDGARPYPWQLELVETVARDGRWPDAIAMPTGAGKSSVVDIHVFLVAERARGHEIARPPRRLVLVAPRRVLVEDQFERARRLAGLLTLEHKESVVREVVESLTGLCSTDEVVDRSPLGVARLRGGVRLDLGWRLDPAQCQIICATPQMWGSRLLLRGFRGSRRSRNLEAGLLGHDVAVVIDEAHLHERLVDTAQRVAAHGGGPLGLQVVAMSATRSGGLRLSERDLADAELRRRVRARKRITIVDVEDFKKDAPAALAEQAQRLAGEGTVGVFVNTVAMALDVAARLDDTVKVVCGRMRPADVASLRDGFKGLLDARGNENVDYLVATQSLEVGVDLDLGAMVTMAASASALAQRAGRLNRSGRREDAELVVIAPRELGSAKQFLPYSNTEIADGVGWLRSLDGDASPERISASSLPVERGLPLPVLTRVELETFAIAGHELAADAQPAFYVNEPIESELPTVSIGARKFYGRGELAVRAALRAAPPRAHELATISLDSLRGVLALCSGSWIMRKRDGQDVIEPLNGEPEPGDVVIVPDGSPILTRGVIGLAGRRKGDSILDVMAERPEGEDPDVILALEEATIESALELDPALASRVARDALVAVLSAQGKDVTAALRGRLRDLAVTWCPDEEREERRPKLGLLVLSPTAHEGRLSPVAVGGEVTVDDHCEAVAARLDLILERLDVDPVRELRAEREELISAARWHDVGKRHPRFQRRIGAVDGGVPLAKSPRGHHADRGDGWRHEQLSAGHAWARSGRQPLPTVLVATHHGHGMPLFDRGPDDVLLGWDAPDVKAALEELFGPYGRYELERSRLVQALGLHRLAHLEALLRCADMQVSREGH